MKLRTSLSLLFALIVVVTVFLTSIISSILVKKEFEEYVTAGQKKSADELAESLESNYNHGSSGWNIDYVHGLGMYALNDGFIIRLYDKDKGILWDAENHDMALCHEVMVKITTQMQEKRPELNGDFVTEEYELKRNGETTGFLEISYYTPYYMNENDFKFEETLNRILGIVAVIALVPAIILGAILARRITRPISDSIKVTGKIADGDYSIQARVGGQVEELEELTDSVNHMAFALKEQENIRRQLTSDIAHELRTPIANISSYMELMIDGVMEPTPERLENCHKEIERLSELISDLELLEKSETAQITFDDSPEDLLLLVREVGAGFETLVKEKGIDFKIKGESIYTRIDSGRIKQVVANLLSNAVKYTDENGRIDIDVARKKDMAVITVTDNGIGIPKEDTERIFDRFYRTDKSRTRKTGGAGIGLSIAKAIVLAHGGTIRCESEMGQGSRFIVSLPMNQ